MKALTKLSNWLLSVYARLLDYAQGTEWWKAHLKREENKVWVELKAKARALFTEDQLKIWGPVIDNQIQYIRTDEAASGGKLSTKRDWIVMTAAKTMKTLDTLRIIVGVQPLQGPVGLVYSMRYAYDEQADPKLLKLQVISTAAEAMTRKLHASWNVESMQDIKAIHGLDLESELTSAIAAEVSMEVFNEVIHDLYVTGKENTIVVDLKDVDLPFIGDLGVLTTVNVNRAATRIADRTRRGAGNFIITSPQIISLLQSCSKSVFEAVQPENAKGDFHTICKVGVLNKSIDVYAAINEKLENNIIIGYKGRNGECDTGYVYSPYIPLMSSGVVMNPLTFQPIVSMMTRYAKTLCKPSNLETAKVSDYYAVVDVTQINDHLKKLMSSSPTVDKSNDDPVQ